MRGFEQPAAGAMQPGKLEAQGARRTSAKASASRSTGDAVGSGLVRPTGSAIQVLRKFALLRDEQRYERQSHRKCPDSHVHAEPSQDLSG